MSNNLLKESLDDTPQERWEDLQKIQQLKIAGKISEHDAALATMATQGATRKMLHDFKGQWGSRIVSPEGRVIDDESQWAPKNAGDR